MKIIITDHAKERMMVRKITEKMIEAAITKPDRSGMGYQKRLLSFKLFTVGVLQGGVFSEQ